MNLLLITFWSMFVFELLEGVPILVNPGLLIISGVKSCRSGTGYCLLGSNCGQGRQRFITDNHNGHCDQLRYSFTPMSDFTCCQLEASEANVSTTIYEEATKPYYVIPIFVQNENATNGLKLNDFVRLTPNLSIQRTTMKNIIIKNNIQGEQLSLNTQVNLNNSQNTEQSLPNTRTKVDLSNNIQITTEITPLMDSNSQEHNQSHDKISHEVEQLLDAQEHNQILDSKSQEHKLIIDNNGQDHEKSLDSDSQDSEQLLLNNNSQADELIFDGSSHEHEQLMENHIREDGQLSESMVQVALQFPKKKHDIYDYATASENQTISNSSINNEYTFPKNETAPTRDDQNLAEMQSGYQSNNILEDSITTEKYVNLVPVIETNILDNSPTQTFFIPNLFNGSADDKKVEFLLPNNNVELINPKSTTPPSLSDDEDSATKKNVIVRKERCATIREIINGRSEFNDLTSREKQICLNLWKFVFDNRILCYGILIDAFWILTTATCVTRVFDDDMESTVAFNIEETSTPYNLSNMIVHENYRSAKGSDVESHNIGLISLNRAANNSCFPCLADQFANFNGSKCVVYDERRKTSDSILCEGVANEGVNSLITVPDCKSSNRMTDSWLWCSNALAGLASATSTNTFTSLSQYNTWIADNIRLY